MTPPRCYKLYEEVPREGGRSPAQGGEVPFQKGSRSPCSIVHITESAAPPSNSHPAIARGDRSCLRLIARKSFDIVSANAYSILPRGPPPLDAPLLPCFLPSSSCHFCPPPPSFQATSSCLFGRFAPTSSPAQRPPPPSDSRPSSPVFSDLPGGIKY